MPLLLDEDYVNLKDHAISYEESEQQRYFIFTGHKLPAGLYTNDICDVLVVIPQNYNQAGNDMFWTFPRLHRKDGVAIPNTQNAGDGNNLIWNNREFCRWSRHWNNGHSVWRPGRDDVISIYRRIEWAFQNPNAQ